MPRICFGIKELDQYLGEAIRPGTTILIAGYPGAGKTTLAATIAYNNCLRRIRVLYVSFFEHLERFMSQMKSLELDFEKFSRENLFKYVKIPLIPSQESVDVFIRNLMKLLSEFKPKIVVIDGVTSLVKIMRDEATIRSFIQTVLYDIPKLINGLLILIADLPFGLKEVMLAGIEFIVDIVFILRYRVITSRVVRSLEIRKVRGAPLDIAEVPYQITKKQGIRLFFPVITKELKPPIIEEPLFTGIPSLDKTLGPIYKGSAIAIVHPPHIRSLVYPYKILANLIINNKLKTVIISYKHSDKEVMKILELLFTKQDYDKLVENVIDVHSFNPTAISFEELFFREDRILEELKPDVVIIFGLDVVYNIVEFSGIGLDVLYSLIYNRILRFKSKGGIVAFFLPKTQARVVEALTSLSDITFTIDYVAKDNNVKPVIIAWKKPYEPVLLSPDLLITKEYTEEKPTIRRRK